MTLRTSAVALLATLAAAGTPLAQSQETPAPREQPASSYSDEELRSFAAVALQVQRINRVYGPKMQRATTPEELGQIADAATTAVKQAVSDEGMTVERFQEILERARVTPELAERVRQHLPRTQ